MLLMWINGFRCQLVSLILVALLCLPAFASAETWSELTPIQKEALAPLSNDWDALPKKQQLHFLKLANHYPKLTLDKKDRLHKQLVAWSKLTPEQRKRAREKYIAFSKATPEKREQVKQGLKKQSSSNIAASSISPVVEPSVK